MKVRAVTPAETDVRGGQVLRLRGAFPAATPLRVSFRLPDGTGRTAYSGQAGQATDCYAFGTALSCVSPAWPPGTPLPAPLDVTVTDPRTGQSATLSAGVRLGAPSPDSQTYALRSLFSPGYAAGPRSLAAEQTHRALPGALLEHLLGAMGASLSEFGGARLSWVARDALPGATELQLQGATGWAASGRFVLGSVLYSYASRTDATLERLSYRRAGRRVEGLAAPALVGAQLTDASRTYSQLDQLRNAYFIGTAQGEDLATCGRNYGLARDPAVPSDAAYARALLSIAYGPRGTLLALRTALDQLLGPGQYTLEEDTLNYPCKVFIRANRAALRTGTSLGRSYPAGPRSLPSTPAGTFELPAPVYGCNRITLPPADLQTVCAASRPAAPWQFQGPGEAAATTPKDDLPGLQRCVFTGQTGIYWGPAGTDPDSTFELAAAFQLENLSASGGTGFVLCASDGERVLAATLTREGGQTLLRPCDATGSPRGTASLPVPAAGLARVGLRRRGRRYAELFCGAAVLPCELEALPTTSAAGVFFGVPVAASASAPRVGLRQVDLFLRPGRNYVEAIGQDAKVVADDAAVALGDPGVTAAAVGKALWLQQSKAARLPPGATRGPAGSNSGCYRIAAAPSAGNLQLTLWSRADGVLGSGKPGQLSLPDAGFNYPEDLGRRLVVGGSSGNAGTYYVAALLGSSGAPHSLPYRRTCSSALLVKADGSAPSFLSQASVPLRLDPTLVPESGLRWSVPDAAEFQRTGGQVEIRPAQTLPEPGGSYAVTYDDVLGCVVTRSTLPEAFLRDEGPPVSYSTYPVYVSDPLSFVGNYAGSLTAAGVRPVFALD